MTELYMELGDRGYGIAVGRGLMDRASSYLGLDRRAIIVTDSGVPREYAERVAAECREASILTVPKGEGSKSIRTLEEVLLRMTDLRLKRSDCAIAVGGGVVGDLVGFAAATYMRGIDFYNIPTTLLSQVDSSIGGKTAVNLGGFKNIVGAFHQPKGVLIDLDSLKTLPKRQISSGLAEAIKMAVCSDEELFRLLERMTARELPERLEQIVAASLRIKKAIVEEDEREGGVRKLLNLGHTLGHGIEAVCGGSLYHGECVALGMLPMLGDGIRERVSAVLEKFGLPTVCPTDGWESIAEAALHDKKSTELGVDAVVVDEIGQGRIVGMTHAELMARAAALPSRQD